MKSVINLVKTNNGYSLVEGDTLVNKISSKSHKQKSYSASKKFVQNYTIYPYISTREKELNHKFVILPARAQWFSLNLVHEIEKKALPEWFKQRKVLFGTVKQEKFQKNEQLYKKYRNYIIQLGKQQYVSAFKARSGLAGDVCAIIRIHQFLQKWGLINYIHPKPKQFNQKNQEIEIKQSNLANKLNLSSRKQCFDKDKSLLSKSYNKQDLELLKKITKHIRVHCHYCEGICGIIWYQYQQQFYMKQFTQEGINKSSQSYIYNLKLCSTCFYQGNIPMVLTMSNFKKITVIDNFQEEPKKKNHQVTKIIDLLEKNKLNFKKTSQLLKINQNTIYKLIMQTPIKKLQKLKKQNYKQIHNQIIINKMEKQEIHISMGSINKIKLMIKILIIKYHKINKQKSNKANQKFIRNFYNIGLQKYHVNYKNQIIGIKV